MRVSTFSKLGISVGAAALLATALVSPAYADPPAPGGNPTFGELVGLGSDTTQDVMNGIAAAIGGGKLASYDATGPTATVITRDGGSVAIPRAANSGGGRDELRVAIGQTTSATVSAFGGSVTANQANSFGAIDFARSSGGPAAADLRNDGAGVLTYVPFARDAVTIGVNPDSALAVVPWVVGDAAHTTDDFPSLYNVYRGTVRYVYATGSAGAYTYVGVGGTSTIPGTAPGGTAAYPVQALLPTAGSGTRSFFIGKLNLTEANITTINTTTPNTVKAVDVHGVAIQEHDGTALIDDTTGMVPFSIGQFVAQSNAVSGVTVRLHGVKILGMNGVNPTTGSAPNYITNSAYTAMVRDVYNIVPSREFDDPDSKIHAAFAGSNSLVCQQSAAIQTYGFQLMPATTADSTCGYGGLEGYDGSNSTVSFTLSDNTVEADEEFTANVTTTSNYTKGGTVFIVNADDDTVGEGEVASGATTAAIPVSIGDIGTSVLHAEFVPTLTGVASSRSALVDDISVTVSGRSTVTALSGATAAQLGKTYGVVVWIDATDPEGGTVTLKDGATTLATATLAAGEQGAYLTFVPTKLTYSLIASYAPPASSTYTGSSSSAKALTVGKGLPTLTVPTPKTVKHTSAGKVSVTVVGVTGGPAPTGTVTVKVGTTTVGTGTLVNGKVTITLKKMSKGTKTLLISYSGDSNWLTASKNTVKIKLT